MSLPDSAATSEGDDTKLTLLLTCFSDPHGAGRVRRALDARLQRQGDIVLDSVVCKINAKGGASVHDPRRDLAGTLTATVTWAVFGFVTGSGTAGVIASALTGAVCGGIYAYLHEHVLTKAQLARIGSQLPPSSSALLSFVKTADPPRVMATATATAPVVTSAATIGEHLDVAVHGPAEQVPDTARVLTPLLTMILFHYVDAGTAADVSAQMPAATAVESPQVELIVREDERGRLHVLDPRNGTRAMARSDLVSWGGFGLVFGALVGAIGGGGILGLVSGAAVSGLVCAIFGLVAGGLYGLLAGRAISARRLGAIRTLLPPKGSSLLAWAAGPLSDEAVAQLGRPGSLSLLLRFERYANGTVLAA